MPSALAVIGTITLVAVGGFMVYEADRLPVIDVTLPIPVWHPKVALPYKSLKIERDDALASSRVSLQAERACKTAIGLQNVAVRKASDEGAAKMAALTRVLDAQGDLIVNLTRAAGRLRAYVSVGPDKCSRWDDADQVVAKALKP